MMASMTRDEIKTSIKNIITNGSDGDIYDDILDTIFAALKEPTEEMILSGGEYVLSVGSIDCMHADDRPEFGIKGRETGSYELFKAMLSASPLAPKGE